jgi:hypothetical protein
MNAVAENTIETLLTDPENQQADAMAKYHYALYSHLRDWFKFRYVQEL